MPPIALAKKILELEESQLIRLLTELELYEIDLYNILKEKIEDI